MLATSVIKENLKKTALQGEEETKEFELSPLNKTFIIKIYKHMAAKGICTVSTCVQLSINTWRHSLCGSSVLFPPLSPSEN